mmetsp:Transcript_158888/g.509550  ORF Transcript_158888/g.509550 Transcript_158888/m.509550 type:complete len:330 (-) Transcript_158888:4966-5955(-)
MLVASQNRQELCDGAERDVQVRQILNSTICTLFESLGERQNPEGDALDHVVGDERPHQVRVHLDCEDHEVKNAVHRIADRNETNGSPHRRVIPGTNGALVILEPADELLPQAHGPPFHVATVPDRGLDQARHQVRCTLHQGGRLVLSSEQVHQVPIHVRHGELLYKNLVRQAHVCGTHCELEEPIYALLQLWVTARKLPNLAGSFGHAWHQLQGAPQFWVDRPDRQEVDGLERAQLHVPLLPLLDEVHRDDHGLAADEVRPLLPRSPGHAVQHLDKRPVGRCRGLHGGQLANKHQHANIGHDLLRLHAGVEQVCAANDVLLQGGIALFA